MQNGKTTRDKYESDMGNVEYLQLTNRNFDFKLSETNRNLDPK